MCVSTFLSARYTWYLLYTDDDQYASMLINVLNIHRHTVVLGLLDTKKKLVVNTNMCFYEIDDKPSTIWLDSNEFA